MAVESSPRVEDPAKKFKVKLEKTKVTLKEIDVPNMVVFSLSVGDKTISGWMDRDELNNAPKAIENTTLTIVYDSPKARRVNVPVDLVQCKVKIDSGSEDGETETFHIY